jgi:RNA polymerase sigma factor (sigma-70 family)
MSSAQVGAVLRYIRKLAVPESDEQLPDGQLLERFATHRDQAAYATLMKRHGPMVLAVCRSVLHDPHDAEDAFQATFVVLAQKAGLIQRQQALSSWLYRVAYHLAMKAQARASRRRAQERKAAGTVSADPLFDMNLRELREVLFEELQLLPEKYRAPLVLCYLEEKTQDEAARVLGWTKGAVKGRLERGRDRLRARLARRGLELSLGLFVTGLAQNSASATIPAQLADSTLKAGLALATAGSGDPCRALAAEGIISSEVAALIQGAKHTMITGKLKIAIAVLLAVTAGATGLGALRHNLLADNEAETKPIQVQRQEAEQGQAPSAKPEAPAVAESLRVHGRVLDPDGKPAAGAKLYLGPTALGADRPAPPRATTGIDGRFEFTFRKSELDKTYSEEPKATVLAMAGDFGCDFATVETPDTELTLRLVKDLPLNGRILDQDGRAVAGVKVKVGWVVAYPGMDLKEVLEDMRAGRLERLNRATKGWTGPLPGQPKVLTTGADGRIRLSGFGRDRIVTLQVEGPGIVSGWVHAMTRPGEPVDLSPYQRYYGATFVHLAQISRPIRGTVRDKVTGKPVASVEIAGNGMMRVTTRTDKDGRYELRGLPKSQRYDLEVLPANGQTYFGGWLHVDDAPGLDPLVADFELVPGIPLRGRVTDKATGKPVPGAHVDYHALFPNPHIGKVTGLPGGYGPHADATSGPDGTFILGVLPGPGAVGVTGPKQDSYMPALVTSRDLDGFSKNWKPGPGNTDDALTIAAGGNSMSFIVQQKYNALVLIDPEEKAESLTRDVVLEPGRTRTGTVVGPDGKPLAGVSIHGLTWSGTETLKTAAFTVQGLNPRRPRELLFLHKEKDLGFFTVLRGEDSTPLKIKLQPCGSVSGRIVDKDGQPVPGIRVHVQSAGLSGLGQYLEMKTGRDGRFRMGGLVPGARYWLMPPTARVLSEIIVEPGKNKELGDVDGHIGENP